MSHHYYITCGCGAPDRCEAWMEKNGELHALLLSCPLEHRADLEKFISDIKAMENLDA